MKDMKPSRGAYQKLSADKRKRQLTYDYDLNFRGTVNPRNLFNEMFLETIPRKLSATKIKRYTVYVENCMCGYLLVHACIV